MVARNSNLILAVGYARRSTDMQERSIPDQQAYVEKWASEHGYRILRWFLDDAISGTSAKGRNAFEQLIASAENGRDFDTVLCYDISRFSRGGTNETGFYLHRLKLAGVDVMFTADGIPEGDEGELIQGVKSWQARQYSVKLARDSIRGQISNIKERKSAPGGPPPYGYDKQHLTSDGKVLRTLRWMQDGSKQEFGPDGKLLRVIARNIHVAKAKGDIVRYSPSTPDRVAVVRRIFDLCAQGYGIKYTAEQFNNEGIPTLTGAKWNSSNIAMMLRCPVYRGAIVYNKRTSGSLFGMDSEGRLRPKKGQGYKLNPQDDWLIVEDVHEPLVSKETFAAATQMRAKNREAAGKARSVSRTLASTLLVCKRCGHSFTTIRDKRCGDDYRHYTCSGYHRYGKIVCGLVNIPGVPLDAFLLETIRRVIFNDSAKRAKVIDTFVKGMLAPVTAAKGSANLERELGQLDRRIKTTVNMLADLSFEGLDDLNRVLIDLKTKRDALVAKLATRQTIPDVLPTERELRSWANEQLQRLEELAKKTKVELPDRQLVESYVDRIEVYPETKTGVIVMHADLRSFFASSSTRVVGGDDPQTDESARSPAQCAQRESILAGAVLGLAGPGKKISGIMPCTVIRPDDMADRILNRDQHPQWQGERTKMLYALPTNDKLWQEYAQIRAESLRQERGLADATEFYRQHRDDMDAGAQVAWPERFQPDELSALQHAMNLKLQDEGAFAAEYQNEPLREQGPGVDLLTAEQICAKLNRQERGTVPLAATKLTAFIDVHQNLLFWMVCSWEDHFTGAIVDYGAYPDPLRPYFTLRDATRTLSTEASNVGLEGAIYRGLETLTQRLLGRAWPRTEGGPLFIEQCLIDANWGQSTEVVYRFCRQGPFPALIQPSHGRFVGASSKPFSEYERRPGDQVGWNWRVPGATTDRPVRHVLIDTNFWKSFVQSRLATAIGDPGSLTLFGTEPHHHRLLAEHLTGEYRIQTAGRGRVVDEWKVRPEQPDNHWLDCLVGATVAA